MILNFKLDDRGFRCLNPYDAIAAVSLQYIKCHFDISGLPWSNVDAVVAVFKSAKYNITSEVLLDSGGNCFIEPEVYKHGGVIQVKLYGDKYSNGVVISSTYVTETIEFVLREDLIVPIPAPSKYDVFLAEIERLYEEFNTKCQPLTDAEIDEVTPIECYEQRCDESALGTLRWSGVGTYELPPRE